ncbi:MAG TPA: endonuclease/exonuclease/phosphatase family protein, partial [Thermomonospora sp.]|nr:endonuclease/exonuclease/phosphatase family protein [Thermomonospora sp.]
AGLSLSPGRVAPRSPAWTDPRKPLAGELLWRGRRLVVLANHWTARGGDDSRYGRFQPPREPSETAHADQARLVADFVRALRAVDRNAAVIVAGDLNAFDHSPALRTLTGGTGLRDLVAGLPESERYTTVTGGNGQAPDHILLSAGLSRFRYDFDIVHLNAEFADQVSDHDPTIVRLSLD